MRDELILKQRCLCLLARYSKIHSCWSFVYLGQKWFSRPSRNFRFFQLVCFACVIPFPTGHAYMILAPNPLIVDPNLPELELQFDVAFVVGPRRGVKKIGCLAFCGVDHLPLLVLRGKRQSPLGFSLAKQIREAL